MKVIWSNFAESQLDEIFHYYQTEASKTTALKLIKHLIDEAEKLSKTPFIGPIEELLKGRKIEYLYIVCKNYKLIYSVDLVKRQVRIADIFDTRQNPTKKEREKEH